MITIDIPIIIYPIHYNKMVDIGANLTDKRFDADRDAIITDSFNAGLAGLVITGTSTNHSRRALELVAKYPTLPLYSTAGVHPHEADRFKASRDIPILTNLLKNPRTVAVGETGLDYCRSFASVENQIACFKAQLELAASVKKPLFLHEREAHADFISCLDSVDLTGVPKIVHCFTGNLDEVKEYLRRDCYIGFTAYIGDRKRNAETVPAMREVPLDRLLVETDSPYMTPYYITDKRNVPVNVVEVVKMIAKLRRMRAYDLWNIVCENAATVFGVTLADPMPNPLDPDEQEPKERHGDDRRERRDDRNSSRGDYRRDEERRDNRRRDDRHSSSGTNHREFRDEDSKYEQRRPPQRTYSEDLFGISATPSRKVESRKQSQKDTKIDLSDKSFPCLSMTVPRKDYYQK